jgi:hypothetical protein
MARNAHGAADRQCHFSRFNRLFIPGETALKTMRKPIVFLCVHKNVTTAPWAAF